VGIIVVKAQISNKMITYLAVIAILLTLFGTTISLVKLGTFEVPFITGLATTSNVTGTVNITVAKFIAVSLNTSLVDFGNGTIGPEFIFTAVNTTAGTNPSTFLEPYGIVIRNDGNVDINVTLNGSTAAEFFPGLTTPSYMWNASQNETNSCGSGNANNISGAILSVTNTHTNVCTNLTFPDSQDEVRIDIYLNVSWDALPGQEYSDAGLEIKGEERTP